MKIHIILFTLLISVTVFAGDQFRVLSMQERAEVIDRLLEDKLKTTLPEDAYFDETGVHYIDGRQTEFILIDAQRGGSL